jgi:hypothetical protein
MQALHKVYLRLMEVRIYTEQIKAKILDCKHRIQTYERYFGVKSLPVSANYVERQQNC